MRNSWNGLTISPLKKAVTLQKADETGMMATRLTRSARAAIGTAPSTRVTPPNPRIPNSTVSLTSSDFWMSGASTRMALGSSSRKLSTNIITSIDVPPSRRPSRRLMGSPPTPGSRSSGSTVSASRSTCSALRRASSSRIAEARSAAVGG